MVKSVMVILSPSGVGKTTLQSKKFNKKLVLLKYQFHTTRPPRSNEADGVDYNFVSKRIHRVNKGKNFMNTPKFLKNYYGTLKKMLMRFLKNIIFDIDWQ